MIKKSIYILLLLSAVAAVAFATIDRKNTRSLLPQRQTCEPTTTPNLNPIDSLEMSIDPV